ncbi:chemotaxis protein CheA [Paenibacillus koleovorans]|uniref:chemotaxis protein CheA n=1 Tax=Paenibacillus koleovorans TaxID=121608 RepID=UPI000FDB0043|nr:chemotaxis protein CheA [Paenibacillus koleovorans]
MELNQYLSMFIDESKEHLQAMNENLLKLEASPEDIGIVQVIFRSAHTLKGMSATMGYEDLALLTHEMENVLDLVRNYKLQMNPYIFDSVFRSVDALETMVHDIIAGGTGKADVTDIVISLKAIVSGEYEQGASGGSGTASAATSSGQGASPDRLDEFQYSVLLQSLEAGMNVFRIEVSLQTTCILKAARAYMVFDTLEQNGEVVKSIPPVEDIEKERFDRSFSLFVVSHSEGAALETALNKISEIESVKLQKLDSASLHQLASAPAGSQGASGSSGGKATVSAIGQISAASAVLEKPQGAAAAPAQQQNGTAPVANRTIRVDIERLDVLMNLFSELLIDRVRLEQLASEIRRNELTETVEHMARVSSDLQNIVLKLRMVPVDTVFNRFPRMIRDLAKSLDKKVDLVITGADTELDRTVIEEIGDPLVHLLRNAVDHGIETIADRIAAGKPETGTVQLRAFHSGNHVFIEIQEDGKGIDRDKVLKSAISKGVLSAEQAKGLPDEQVFQLLFASGFSTADKISDVSGRGVGLDVVKTKIESLGGHVQITSQLGVGTTFSVQLPLTLSIISAMLIKMGDEKYAIPLTSILETSIVQRSQIRLMHGSKVIEFRNHIIPLVSLSKLFDIPSYSEEKESETEIVVIRKGDKMAALMVDDLIGQQEIVLKSLGKYLTNLFAVSGATILGDGQVALILDTNALIK